MWKKSEYMIAYMTILPEEIHSCTRIGSIYKFNRVQEFQYLGETHITQNNKIQEELKVRI